MVLSYLIQRYAVINARIISAQVQQAAFQVSRKQIFNAKGRKNVCKKTDYKGLATLVLIILFYRCETWSLPRTLDNI
jgi:hypothetical protein